MQIDYVGRGMRLDDDLRSLTEKKLSGATRFLEEPVEIRVILERSGHRRIAEMHLHHRFGVMQATEEATDLREAIQEAAGKIQKQARRARKKFMAQRRRGDRQLAHEWAVAVLDRASVGGGSSPRIVKTSALSIKPMSLDEAALRLETAKNDFVVFRDADHGRINVLYKRRDGDLGLVSPEG